MFKKIREIAVVETRLMRDDEMQRKAAKRGSLLTIKPDGTETRNTPDYESRIFRRVSGQL
ncbi:hypothetical protein [Actinacidiphila sp. bgisy144]|uniref:hypothetical protein n=1 Tax=Actinacidiphila sp. bgisy144 TaxID=3413791 RepID=UPI003EBF0764